jgi:signal transduction histidine kinase
VDLSALEPGLRLSGWKLVRELDSGGAVACWLAEDEHGRQARVDLLDRAPSVDLAELARLPHPALPELITGGQRPLHHMVFRCLPGRPLNAFLRSGPAPPVVAMGVAAVLADALATAHRAGMVHGDIRPDSVVIASPSGPRLHLVGLGRANIQGSGALAYAAPERLQGGPATPTSDCYSLGLLLWEMVHGQLPWPELSLSEALLRRAAEAPEPSQGAAAVRALLRELLHPDPEQRPRASRVADRLLRAGAPEPVPDIGMVRRRAARLRIFNPLVADAMRSWLDEGGSLALVGTPGSGRSHVLERLGRESLERGLPVVRLDSSERPWAAVERALHSPSLPGGPVELPQHADADRKAELAAVALMARCPEGFVVLVDDYSDQDASVHMVAESLGRQGVRVAVAGAQAPPWSADQCLLEPLDLEGTRSLLRGLLGPVRGGQRLAEQLHSLCEGLPAACVCLVVAAIEQGALRWRAQRWQVDPERLTKLLSRGMPEGDPTARASADAQLVGGRLALLETPVSLDFLASLVDITEDRLRLAVDELLDLGVVRMEARTIACRGVAASHSLLQHARQPEQLHRVMVEHLTRQHAPDLLRLGWHIVGSRDRAKAERYGAEILAAAVARSGSEAVQLSDELWALNPGEALAAPRMRAMMAAGLGEDARRFGEQRLAERDPQAADVPLLVELARIHIGTEGRDDLALGCIARARLALGAEPLPPELIHAEAQIHHRAGRHDDAIAAARPLAEGPPSQGPERLERWMRLRVVWALALAGQGRHLEGLSLLDGLPDDLGRGSAARARLDATLAELLLETGRLRDAVDAFERAAHDDAGLAAPERAALLYRSGRIRRRIGDLQGSLACWERALLLFEREGEPRERVRVQSKLCVAFLEQGRWERAIEAGTWAALRATELGSRRDQARAAARLGDVHLSQGAWGEAQRWYRRAEGLAREHGYHELLATLARCRAELAVLRQDPRGTALSEHALQVATQAGTLIEGARSSALLAFCHARAGRIRELDLAARQAIEPLRVAGAATELAEARLWLADAYLLAGRVDEALAESTRALVFADEVGHVPLRRRAAALVDRVRGIRGGVAADADLERLLELAVAVAEERDLEQLLAAIASAALELLNAERVFVLVNDDEGGLDQAASAWREGVSETRPSMAIVHRVMEDGREVVVADLGERPDLWDPSMGSGPDLRSAMCIPMVQGEERFGAIYVDGPALSAADLDGTARLLRALAGFGAVAAINANHMQEVARQAEQTAELAHDLKSPASAIHLSVSALLADKPEGDPERDVLMRVLEAAQRIRSMAGGLLDEHRPTERPVLLSSLVDRVVGLLRHVAAQRGVRLELAITPNLWVNGDPQELSRVVSNLVSNALKVAPKGSRIAVGLAQDGQGVVCIVRDQGPGIPAGMELSIFERGKRGNSDGPGQGLGLYICQRIVREHGGSISARNHRRGGAVITVRLPRRVRAWDSLPAHAEAERT